MNTQLEEYFGETVYSYTREQAIADGVLIDVTEPAAKDFGFKVPVAITQAVWQDCISRNNNTQLMYQYETDHLADILWVCYLAAQKTQGDTAFFDVIQIPEGQTQLTTVKLKSIIGPGDTPSPVLTIMFPQED